MPELEGKLGREVLSTDGLLEYLPFLKEILDAKELSRSQLDNFAKDAASLRRLRAGEVVCEEGDFGSTAFFLVSGKVEVSINHPLAQLRTRRAGGGLFRRNFAKLKRMSSFLVSDRDMPRDENSRNYIPIDAWIDLPRDRPIAELGPGEIFGEMTCRTFQPRSATVTCVEDCVLVEMLRVVLDMLTGNRAVSDAIKAATKVKAATFKGSPTFRKMVDDKYRARSLNNHLHSVPMFAGLDDAFLTELVRDVEFVSYGAGDAIVTQGEAADAFYLVRTGMVKVSEAMPGGEIVRTYMTRGDFFGEIGLIQPDGKRTATCRALDQTDLVRIKRELFSKILEHYPQVRVQVKLVADTRLRASLQRKLPTGMNMDEFLDQGLFEAQNLLLIDLDKCTRCDACVTACAEAHDGVTRLLRDGLRYDRYLVATACRSCHDPLCMTQCPVGSIRRKDSLEIQIESWCIGCSKCAELCPYGNINMHPFEAPEKPAKPAPAAAAAKPAAPAAGAKPAVANAAKPVVQTPVAAKPAPAAPAAAKTPAADKPAAPVVTEHAAQPVAFNDIKPPAAVPEPAAPPPDTAKGWPPSTGTAPGSDQPANLPERFPASAAAPPARIVAAVPGVGKPPSSEGPRDNAPGAAIPAVGDPQAAPAEVKAAATVPAAVPSPATTKPVDPAADAKPAAVKSAEPAAKAAEETSAKPAVPSKTPAAKAAAKPAAAPPAAGAAKPAAAGKPAEKKKAMTLKATTCDLCTDLITPSCVYACPHDAAMRVDPTRYFAGQKSASDRRRRSFLSRLFFGGEPDNRTTH